MSGVDRLRLAVSCSVDDDAADSTTYDVEVFVNEVEMTSRGAGRGMDPYDILVPSCSLRAEHTPRRVALARCLCGEYGCDLTDVVITRQGISVRWEWKGHAPLARPVTFALEEYEAEVRRAEADHSWEPWDRTAGRLVLDGLADRALPAGFAADRFWKDGEDSFEVGLMFEDSHQIFVRFPRAGRDAAGLAEHVITTLTERPLAEWTARWFACRRPVGPPRGAPPTWTMDDHQPF